MDYADARGRLHIRSRAGSRCSAFFARGMRCYLLRALAIKSREISLIMSAFRRDPMARISRPGWTRVCLSTVVEEASLLGMLGQIEA
jgi:hypothetical protein